MHRTLLYQLVFLFSLQVVQLYGQERVSVLMPQEPESLNPLLSNTASAEYVQKLLFSSLLEYEPETMQLRPHLATALPELSYSADSSELFLDYELAPEASWGKGRSILAEDYLFSLKVLFCPGVQAGNWQSFCHFIKDVELDAQNPRRFRLICKPYFLAKTNSGILPLLPSFVYDKKKVLAKYSFSDFRDSSKLQSLRTDAKLKKFAKQFHERHNKSPKQIVGSGAYTLLLWEAGKEIILLKKQQHWTRKRALDYLQSYPDTIRYIFSKQAKEEIEKQSIDVAYDIAHRDFVDIINSEARNYYRFHTPAQLNYHYIGINNQQGLLADKRLRKALAHALDRERLMQNIFGGLALKVNGPIHPSKPHAYRYLPDVKHKPSRSAALLASLGLEKQGEQLLHKGQPLRLNYIYIESYAYRRLIGQRLAEALADLGIELVLEALTAEAYYERLRKRDYDLYAGAWALDPGLDNLRQLWHSQSDRPDGSNYLSFRNKEVDALIEELESCSEPKRQLALFQEIQEQIYEEQPCIFLFSNSGHIAIHWRFDKVKISLLRPGFQVNRFKENLDD